MQVIRNRQIVEDDRTFTTPARWSVGQGVRLRNDTEPAEIADQLAAWPAIAIEFPKYTDGRGYSLARLLRQRYGYVGELRAVGDVLHDQLSLMERCGFDTFELKAGKDMGRALAAFDALPPSRWGGARGGVYSP